MNDIKQALNKNKCIHVDKLYYRNYHDLIETPLARCHLGPIVGQLGGSTWTMELIEALVASPFVLSYILLRVDMAATDFLLLRAMECFANNTLASAELDSTDHCELEQLMLCGVSKGRGTT